jgi:predicted phage terminase large subunit-like protein
MSVMGRDSNTGIIYIKEIERFRASFNDILNKIKAASVRHKPKIIAIENTQYQTAVIQELARTTSLPVRGVRPDRDKITRFAPLLTRYEQKLVRHDPSGCPSWFVDELCTFPESDHDDAIDACSYAFNMLTQANSYAASNSKPHNYTK